jgi:hypothetical protein
MNDTAMIARIRAVLTAFDWEHDDRQYALEEIDLIVNAAPSPGDFPQRAVRVEVRDVYGKPMVYPACDTARSFAALTGTKTFTELHMSAIRDLGYAVIIDASQQLPDGYASPDAIDIPGHGISWLPDGD